MLHRCNIFSITFGSLYLLVQSNLQHLRIYLDTCCLSRLLDLSTQERVIAEAEAVRQIFTYDRLLRRAQHYQAQLYIRVENPVTWLEEVTGSGYFRDDRS